MSEDSEQRIFQILLVEDNAADVYLLRQAFTAADLKVELTIIEDGVEAIAFARRQGKYAAMPAPDLAVLDLNLPKASGAAVLEAMRQNQELAAVPVAIMTSAAPPSEQTKAKELGVGRYITKPPELEDFLQIGHVLKEMLVEIKTGSGSRGGSAAIQKQQ